MCSYLKLESKMQSSGCIISEITLLSVLSAFPGFQSTLLPAIRELHSNSEPEGLSVSKEASFSVGHPERSLYNCSLRGFTQQLTKIDKETHRHTLKRAL